MSSRLCSDHTHGKQLFCSSSLWTGPAFSGAASSAKWPASIWRSRRPLCLGSLMGSNGSWIWSGSQSRDLGVRCASEKKEGSGYEGVANVPEVTDTEGILPPNWPTVGLGLFGLGFLLGPPLDGLHSRVQLQVYDVGAVDILGLKTNIWVPPLLGVFYAVVGLIQLALDRSLAPKDTIPKADLKKVTASFLTLALLLELSAEMYKAGVPYNIEAYILFGLAELNWLLLENTWWGFALACFVGVACPLAEIPILKLFDLWHYPKANLSIFGVGVVTWVVCCYFFYTPFIGNLARWLSQELRKGPSD
ncbi:hypothetical protein Mapa_003238 [Marchantia paleacea]|nr:hypothetical protein Mapa_003238 [Marchantia paleacea]